jgi:hypothetical protein
VQHPKYAAKISAKTGQAQADAGKRGASDFEPGTTRDVKVSTIQLGCPSKQGIRMQE